jgi:hypothetical protein
MKEQILRLRAEGKTYREIVAIVGCARSNVAYHCSNLVKANNAKRTTLYRKAKSARHKLSIKITKFRINDTTREKLEGRITLDEVHAKFGDTTTCYLTGRPINLSDDKYHLDHILAVSKGGGCNITNLGITCPEANYAKGSLSVQELLELCKEILIHHGYDIT